MEKMNTRSETIRKRHAKDILGRVPEVLKGEHVLENEGALGRKRSK